MTEFDYFMLVMSSAFWKAFFLLNFIKIVYKPHCTICIHNYNLFCLETALCAF